MNYLKIFGLVSGTALGTAGAIYGAHSVVDYVKERNSLKDRLDLAEYNLFNIDEKNRESINTLVRERDALKEKLNSVKWALQKGRDFIVNDIKKIKDMKNTLQGRIDLIYKSEKFLEDPYRKIASNFENASYLASE